MVECLQPLRLRNRLTLAKVEHAHTASSMRKLQFFRASLEAASGCERQ